MEYVIKLAEAYLLGGVIFAAYNILEITSLHKQSTATRDKNTRNASLAQAKDHMAAAVSFWKWPYSLFKSTTEAIKWLKSE